MTKEEMAKAYAEGFEDKNYREIAYAAFLCGFTAKCESSLPSNLDEAAEEYGRDTFINECMENGVCDAHDLSDAFKARAEWREAQIPKLPDNLDDAAWNYVAKKYGIKESEKIFENEEIAEDFKAGAEWMAGQGVSMQITDDTEWEEVDSFIHKNVDGCSIIQIRKK